MAKFIPSLNKQPKSTSRKEALEVNDVVWPLGDSNSRTSTGPDKLARSSEFNTALGILTGPAFKLMHVYSNTSSW